MTREQKIEKRKARAYKRKATRIAKDSSYLNTSFLYDKSGISWGRRKQRGRVMTCEMGYSDCELRGYCNGDC